MENKNSNPIVQEVKEKFETVKQMTKIFATSNGAAMRGIIITGNAGIGKTHFVKQAFIETDTFDRVDYVKGSSITAPAFYYRLWLNRLPGQILVLDDVDLVQKSKAEVSAILDLMKGATEPTKGERQLSWLRASSNVLFKENGVPDTFDFQGSIVWITNETQESLAKACGPHWNAISSRFRQVPVWLDDKESLMYTIHLIEEAGLLGKDCEAKEGGYSEDIIKETVKYLRENWKGMNDITPRVAVKIADTIESYPNDWKIYIEYER